MKKSYIPRRKPSAKIAKRMKLKLRKKWNAAGVYKCESSY